MKLDLLAWQTQRLMLDRIGYLRPFSKKAHQRVLWVSAPDPICHTQIFPFFYHARDWLARYGVEMREIPLARWLSGDHPYQDNELAAVCWQTWFDWTPDQLLELAAKFKTSYPNARQAYVDWFAPADLRYASVLNDVVDVYLKKQIFRDREAYGKHTLGDTNLTDYYARRFDLPEATMHYPVPETFWPKLFLSPHFAFSPHMLPYFASTFPDRERKIDMHARIAIKGTPWYSAMRGEALQAVQGLSERLTVICEGRVSRKQYFDELFHAKLCFSPFGYGEVCWRDFEAMFTGSLLLKPDMAHLECYPDVFEPYQTYVPLAWDLSDFRWKVDHYLSQTKEREAIARQAFEHLRTYFIARRFVDDTAPFFARLGLG